MIILVIIILKKNNIILPLHIVNKYYNQVDNNILWQDQKKTFDHLNGTEVNDEIKERLYFKSSKATDYERFTQMMDLKRYNDYKIFAKLTAIIKPYHKLEFQKFSQELEALDCLYSIQNKKVMNHQMIKSLSQSLKQIEKHCQKIKKEIFQEV